MYLKETEFREYKKSTDKRFESVDFELKEIKSEVSGIYTLIRETFEETRKKFREDTERMIQVALEEFDERTRVMGEKADMYRQMCLDEHIEINFETAETSLKIAYLEAEFKRTSQLIKKLNKRQ